MKVEKEAFPRRIPLVTDTAVTSLLPQHQRPSTTFPCCSHRGESPLFVFMNFNGYRSRSRSIPVPQHPAAPAPRRAGLCSLTARWAPSQEQGAAAGRRQCVAAGPQCRLRGCSAFTTPLGRESSVLMEQQTLSSLLPSCLSSRDTGPRCVPPLPRSGLWCPQYGNQGVTDTTHLHSTPTGSREVTQCCSEVMEQAGSA